jgi:hypothetical protein
MKIQIRKIARNILNKGNFSSHEGGRGIRLHGLGVLLLLLMIFSTVQAVELDSKNRDPKYVETIVSRSKKIVDKLELKDEIVARNVLNVIANKYFALNDIYTQRDSSVAKIKRSNLTSDAKKSALTAAENEKESAIYRSHFAFPAELSLFLTELQIETIKDGITFGVVKVTYEATLEMIPTLKEEEKVQILAWLKEAREFSIDAENSNKKHEAFGKYKGRINNYLSKRGYNLVKERDAWYERIKTRDAQKKK